MCMTDLLPIRLAVHTLLKQLGNLLAEVGHGDVLEGEGPMVSAWVWHGMGMCACVGVQVGFLSVPLLE